MAARQRVAVVTGASSGIGKAAAKALLEQGWRVIAHGRDAGRVAAAGAELGDVAAPGQLTMIRADLAHLAEAAAMAREIATLTDRVDVLLANAGGVARDRRVTPEGNEATFAGNHLGHFLLVERLLPLLRAATADMPAGAVRVVSTSSTGHEHSRGLNWDNLQMLDGYVSGAAYCNAKLANILFTRELARRVAADGIVAHAMHPGVVDSNFASHADDAMQAYMGTLGDRMQRPAKAADTLVWLATDAAAGYPTGGYFHERQAIAASAAARDDATAARLWAESERLVTRAGV